MRVTDTRLAIQAGALDASAALSENVEAEGFLLNRFYIHIMFEARQCHAVPDTSARLWICRGLL